MPRESAAPRHAPKSQSLICPFAPINMFWGFMSLWMILLEWR